MSNPLKKSGLKNANESTVCRHSDNFQYSLSNLTLQAKRALFLMLAQIDNPKEIPKDDELIFEIKASDFSKLCGLSDKVNIYGTLESAARDLSKSFIYEDVSKGSLKRTMQTNITSKVIYHYSEGYCTIKINRDAYPYFFALSKSFTRNNLQEVLKIPEKTLFNLHQVIMKRYSKSNINIAYKTSFIIGIEELKDEMWLFNTDNDGKNKVYKYPRYADLAKLLNSLIKGLKENTSFKIVSFEIAEKKGRKATHLKISYQHINDIRRQEEKKLNQELNEIEDNLYKLN